MSIANRIAILSVVSTLLLFTSCKKENTKIENGYENGHEYVDLGLPSGTLWATCNVGADDMWHRGLLFSWGEVCTKDTFEWWNYKWVYYSPENGGRSKLLKYNFYPDAGSTDYKSILESSDDAASVNWGGKWRTPRKEECEELIKKCQWIYKEIEGISGCEVTGPNGNTIFIPAKTADQQFGYYWTNSIRENNSYLADIMYFAYESACLLSIGCNRCYGYNVRPVIGPANVDLPTVYTVLPEHVTAIDAMCGGDVRPYDDGVISERGVCWSTNPNPTTAGSHVTCGNGIGLFKTKISGLEQNNVYYVRAYATNEKGTSYGNEVTINISKSAENGDIETITVNDCSFDMVFVKGGAYYMGAQCDDPFGVNYDTMLCSYDSPVHQVTLTDFYVGKYEVTQGLWSSVMDELPYGINHNNYGDDPNNPVYYVSWNDCQEFIKKLNKLTGRTFRLLSEAEWEYSARGGSLTNGYLFSGSNTMDDVGWYYANSNGKTHIVGTKQPNELGIYDMSGNVFEWCQDCFGYYSADSQTNPFESDCNSIFIIRGNSWGDYDDYSHVTTRNKSKDGSSLIGFRLCML